jgi:hypothetical protein
MKKLDSFVYAWSHLKFESKSIVCVKCTLHLPQQIIEQIFRSKETFLVQNLRNA